AADGIRARNVTGVQTCALPIAPSRPTRPTVAEAATTLCTATILPAAPPTAWAATTVSGLVAPMAVPVENWNCENMMFETVFDPATNAPRAPTNGARSGQASPTVEAAASARVTGIDSSPAPL